METIDYLKAAITLWNGDYQILRYEVNLLGDVVGVSYEFLNRIPEFELYTKATVQWNNTTYTINKLA